VSQGVLGRLRPRIILTFRHYKGGRSSAKRTGRLYPRRNPWYSLSEDESTSGHMVLSGIPRKKFPVTQPGIDPGTVRLVAPCLNHYAIPGPSGHMCQEFNKGTLLFISHTQLRYSKFCLFLCRWGRRVRESRCWTKQWQSVETPVP